MEFTALANRAQGLPFDALLDCFISGLKSDIRQDVLIQCPLLHPKSGVLSQSV